MSALTLEQATEAIYQSIHNDNEDIDLHIAHLKAALNEEGQAEAKFDATRLVESNRAGRKRMQSYFRKRGVKVMFGD